MMNILKTSRPRFGIAVMLWAAIGFSVPSAYVSDFGALDINNQTNSTLLRDTKDSRMVWVLPPSAGKTEFVGLVPSANLGFCPGLRDLTVASNDLDKRIANIYQKQELLAPELEAAEKQLAEARRQLGEVAELSELRAILAKTDEITDMEDRRLKGIEALETCVQSCEPLMNLVQQLGEDLRTAKRELRELESANRESVRQYKICQSRVDQARENLDGVGQRYFRLTTMLAEASDTVMKLYSAKGKLEGGFAQIDYDTGWDANVSQLQAQFPQYHFERISTYNVRVFGNIVGASDRVSYYESLPMILDYSINGLKYVPWAQVDAELSALPSVMGGNIRLSTLGACPIIDPEFFARSGMKPDKGVLGTPMFSISATFSIPAAFKFKVKASYNLFKFYEQVRKQGTSGGFFSSKAYSSVVENKDDHDMFQIDWDIEDPNSEFTAEKRSEIRVELKANLLDRVLNTIAQPGIDGATGPVFTNPGVPPTPGAIVLAKGLNQTCGFNIYCRAGSWVLRGLGAIFGSSSTEQSFRQTWDRTATEVWSSEIATLRPAATVFRR